jgi:hypothetical protein
MEFNISRSWKGYYATMKGKNIKEIFPFIEYDNNDKCYFILYAGHKIKFYEIGENEYRVVIEKDKDYKIEKFSILFLILFGVFGPIVLLYFIIKQFGFSITLIIVHLMMFLPLVFLIPLFFHMSKSDLKILEELKMMAESKNKRGDN